MFLFNFLTVTTFEIIETLTNIFVNNMYNYITYMNSEVFLKEKYCIAYSTIQYILYLIKITKSTVL